MEAKRLSEKNRIYNEIKLLKSFIEHDKSTIDRYRNQTSNIDYNISQIKKLKDKNVEREYELEKFEERLEMLKNGDLDKELVDEHKKSFNEVNAKNINSINKKIERKKEKELDSNKSKIFYQLDVASSRQTKATLREMQRTYKYFLRTCDSIPDYMIEKLNNMPNNKGYIWRNIYCYGKLPEEKGKPVNLFETKKDNLHITHEWTNTEYKIWHKQGIKKDSQGDSQGNSQGNKKGNNKYDKFKKDKKIPQPVKILFYHEPYKSKFNETNFGIGDFIKK